MAIPRIKVLDYQGLGRKFIQWARDPDTRPATLAQFTEQTKGMVDPLPDYIKALMFVQSDKEVLLLRLPPAELIEDTLNNLPALATYPLPDLYVEKLIQGMHDNPLEFFEFRVADYVIAHCH